MKYFCATLPLSLAIASCSLFVRAVTIVSVDCVASTDERFVCNSTLSDYAWFQWTIDEDINLLSGRMEAEAHKEVYVGWGVSKNGEMIGSDAIIYNAEEGNIWRYELLSYGSSAATLYSIQHITNKYFSFDEERKRIAVEFSRPLEPTHDDHVGIDINNPSHIIWSIGATSDLQHHHRYRGSCLINLSDGSRSRKNLGSLDDGPLDIMKGVEDDVNPSENEEHRHFHFLGVNLHGCVMILSFIFLFPFGIFSARYLKLISNTSTTMWFRVHYFTQFLGFMIAIYGAVLAWKLVRVFGGLANLSAAAQAHAVLGIALMTLLVLQILAALFRPNTSPMMSFKRSVWAKLHAFVGLNIFVGGFVETLIGLGFSRYASKGQISIFLAFCIFLLIALLFERIHKSGATITQSASSFRYDSDASEGQKDFESELFKNSKKEEPNEFELVPFVERDD